MSIKLLVCDDHEVIRTGLASLLAGTELEIVGEAANGQEAVAQAQKTKPDVILLDIRMPDGDGLSILEKIRAKAPEAKVVMLSTYDNPTYIARAVALGASDYVLKGASREDLVAVHAVVNEERVYGLINRLKRAGARDILVMPIERIIR